MKNIICSFLITLIAASMAYGAASVPPMNVVVSDAGGKAAYKGSTNASGAFATTKLAAGNYVVQLRSASPAVKGNHYAVVLSAGTKKVAANAVAGEKLAGGGVALKVAVGAGMNITGQVAAEANGAVNKNGKKMVWIPPQLGSHQPGHWAEEGSPEAVSAKSAGSMSNDAVRRIQDSGKTPSG
jgi:hypothetical protein